MIVAQFSLLSSYSSLSSLLWSLTSSSSHSIIRPTKHCQLAQCLWKKNHFEAFLFSKIIFIFVVASLAWFFFVSPKQSVCSFRSETFCLNEELVFIVLFGAWLVSFFSSTKTKRLGLNYHFKQSRNLTYQALVFHLSEWQRNNTLRS